VDPPSSIAPWHSTQLLSGFFDPGAWATPLFTSVCPSGAFARSVEDPHPAKNKTMRAGMRPTVVK